MAASDSENFGYGQQDPNDSTSDFNKISFAVRQMMAKLNTMKLVKVTAVHVDAPKTVGPAGTVDVLPLVTQLDGNGNSVPHGTVYGIPFFRLGGGGNALVCDPQVDDIGMVLVSDRDISAVKSTRAQAIPGSRRMFDIADGVYVGGVLALTPTCYVAFVDVNGAPGIVLSPDGGTTSITIAAGKVTIVADEIISHAKVKNVWDALGTGFVYQAGQIDTYTTGVPSSPHAPHPPEVPT